MNEYKPYLHVELGTDGNPEIKAFGSETDQQCLCVALIAGMTQMYGSANLGEYLKDLMLAAIDLLERMEEVSRE